MEAATSPFTMEEVKSSVYLTAKIPGIPPGPSLNIAKRLDYSPLTGLLSLTTKSAGPFFRKMVDELVGSHPALNILAWEELETHAL